jgi:hypothetical protein
LDEHNWLLNILKARYQYYQTRKLDDHMGHAWGTQKECHIATHNIQNSKMEQPVAKDSSLEKNSNFKITQNESICKMRVQEQKLLIYAKIWKLNN